MHIGGSIPPQADAGWIGEAGPGPSYGDVLEDGSRVGFVVFPRRPAEVDFSRVGLVP